MSERRDRDQELDREREQATIPVAEERLDVETRPAELGEVQVRKTVEEERQTVPVELEREEVRVDQRDMGDRPVQPGDQAFQEGTLRVPVRGEEAVVDKEAVVTGEVVVGKERTTERQEVGDTVRRERVAVDRDAQQAGASVVERAGGATTGAGAATSGATAGGAQVQTGAEVVGADEASVGRVKEVRDTDFLVDRRMRRDVYVPFDAVQSVTGGRVVLTIPAEQVDEMGWANPSLT